MPDNSLEQKFREEAERLKLLDRETQRDLVGMVRFLAKSPRLSKDEREWNRRRANALERFLGLSSRKRRRQVPPTDPPSA